MTNNLTTFTFNTSTIRVVQIDGEPWFVANDVCRVLGIENVGSAYVRLDRDEVSNVRRADVGMTPGRAAVIISESGLYKLVLRSDKPEAKAFQDWVTRTVAMWVTSAAWKG